MTIQTNIQLTTWGKLNPQTQRRKITKMECVTFYSNGIPQPEFERNRKENKLTVWCKENFLYEHDGDHFVFIKVSANTSIEIVYKVIKGDAE